MLTDTHCHLDLNKFDADREEVIQRASAAGVTRMLIPALELESSLAVLKLAESHPNLYAAIGFHPTDLDKWNESSIEKLRELIFPHPNPSPGERGTQGEGKIVAIGEIGLDYYWVKEPHKRAQQREVLKQQLMLAQELNKPAVIHMREENDGWFGQASIDLLEILGGWHNELKQHNEQSI
jgi:TatD DNase family protein